VSSIDLHEVTDSVLSDLDDLIASRGASVEVADLPHVRGSAPLLERVVQNLVVNAINYGDPVEPRVRIEGGVRGGEVHVRVRDNGAGVVPDQRESIFDMFSRGDAGELAPGSGIGLAFARRVVARHGGTLTVSNGDDGGACFTLVLPGRVTNDA